MTPLLFVGIFIFLLLILYFLNSNIQKRERIVSGLFLGFLTLSFMFNILFVVWNMGVEHPSSSIYRYGFVVNFFIICIAYKSFINISFLRKKDLILGAFIFSCIISAVYFKHYYFMEDEALIIDYIYGISIFVIIYLALRFERFKYHLLTLLIICHTFNIFTNIKTTKSNNPL